MYHKFSGETGSFPFSPVSSLFSVMDKTLLAYSVVGIIILYYVLVQFWKARDRNVRFQSLNKPSLAPDISCLLIAAGPYTRPWSFGDVHLLSRRAEISSGQSWAHVRGLSVGQSEWSSRVLQNNAHAGTGSSIRTVSSKWRGWTNGSCSAAVSDMRRRSQRPVMIT